MSTLSEQHVKLDGRHFVVKSDLQGPRIIYERKWFDHHPLKGWFNQGYWHRDNHKPGKAWTIVSRILAALK